MTKTICTSLSLQSVFLYQLQPHSQCKYTIDGLTYTDLRDITIHILGVSIIIVYTGLRDITIHIKLFLGVSIIILSSLYHYTALYNIIQYS